MSIHIHDIKATGTIQGSQLTAKQAITGTTMYLTESMRFLRKLDGNWTSRFSIAQSDNGNGIISATNTINIKGETINIEGEQSDDGNGVISVNNTINIRGKTISIEGELLINGEIPLINIAGTDISVWGGTLSTEALAASLEEHGINANYANQARRAEALVQTDGTAGDSSSPVYFDDGLPIECKMTNITLYSSNNDKNILNPPNHFNNFNAWYDLPPFSAGNDTCTLLSNIFIQGAQGDTYGFTQSDLPSNPENGQIFFKIDESNENIITTDNGKWIPAIPYIYISND